MVALPPGKFVVNVLYITFHSSCLSKFKTPHVNSILNLPTKPISIVIMVSNELGGTDTRFEILGKQLQDAMSSYLLYLRKENVPPPSFAPISLKSTTVKHAEGIASRKAIVDLAQQICAMAMDPSINLLISSLQVSSIHPSEIIHSQALHSFTFAVH